MSKARQEDSVFKDYGITERSISDLGWLRVDQKLHVSSYSCVRPLVVPGNEHVRVLRKAKTAISFEAPMQMLAQVLESVVMSPDYDRLHRPCSANHPHVLPVHVPIVSMI